jgi:transposase
MAKGRRVSTRENLQPALSVFHMLTRNEPYRELGGDYFDERRRHYTVDRLASRIEHLGYRVHLEPLSTAVA